MKIEKRTTIALTEEEKIIVRKARHFLNNFYEFMDAENIRAIGDDYDYDKNCVLTAFGLFSELDCINANDKIECILY